MTVLVSECVSVSIFGMENRLCCQNYDILTLGMGKTILRRQIWRQISWNSQKRHSNVRMPTNDRIELKTCMDTYFHPRNAMVVSEYLYFELMKAKTWLWRQIWRQISYGSPKFHSICIFTYFHPKNDGVVTVMIFRLFEGLKRHCALKYDVKYHNDAEK